jgi:hypothetical protein
MSTRDFSREQGVKGIPALKDDNLNATVNQLSTKYRSLDSPQL